MEEFIFIIVGAFFALCLAAGIIIYHEKKSPFPEATRTEKMLDERRTSTFAIGNCLYETDGLTLSQIIVKTGYSANICTSIFYTNFMCLGYGYYISHKNSLDWSEYKTYHLTEAGRKFIEEIRAATEV